METYRLSRTRKNAQLLKQLLAEADLPFYGEKEYRVVDIMTMMSICFGLPKWVEDTTYDKVKESRKYNQNGIDVVVETERLVQRDYFYLAGATTKTLDMLKCLCDNLVLPYHVDDDQLMVYINSADVINVWQGKAADPKKE